MNEYRFTAEVARQTRVANSSTLWAAATTSLRERAYTASSGVVRVRTDWTPLASEEDVVRVDVKVLDEGAHLAPRDVPSFVELFFHDVFLLFNIAVPGSFGGAITVTGGEFRVNELAFDASSFVYSAAPDSIPLAEVVARYRGGTEQVASTPMQEVLFHLLHIGRGDTDEWMMSVRLNECLRALCLPEVEVIPVVHPMHDEALDDRLDDEGMESIDEAMGLVLRAVQAEVRVGTRLSS
jgi:hypothetical protein